MTSAVIVSLRVDASPEHVFDAFMQEIGEWWRPHRLFRLTPRGDGRLRFEPDEGGRCSRHWRSTSADSAGA